MSNVYFSIIIPITVTDYFEECIESLLNQSLENYEIILCDFGLSNKTIDGLDDFIKNFSHIKFYENLKFNEILEEVRGQYILLMNSYDTLSENALYNVQEQIKTDNYPDIIYFGYNAVDVFGKINTNMLNNKNDFTSDFLFNKDITCWSKVYKKSFLKNYEINFNNKNICYDLLFNIKSNYFSNKNSHMKSIFYRHKVLNFNFLLDNLIELYMESIISIKKFLKIHTIYEKYEMEYLSYILYKANKLFELCSTENGYKLFDSFKTFLSNESFSKDMLLNLDFKLYQVYIHILLSNSIYEFKSFNNNDSNITNEILLDQIYEKNQIISEYELQINELEYYKKILNNISNAFDKGHFFEEKDFKKIVEMDLFDETYYLQNNDRDITINPLLHYMYMGYLEGKNPSELFDTSFYAKYNTNVIKKDMNPLLYFVKRGINEGLIKVNENVWQPEYINKYVLDEKIESLNSYGLNTSRRDQRLIVSLTSFPERMYDIHYCLYSLLTQNVKPDLLILWLAADEFPNGEYDVPSTVLNLKRFGLEIKFCENLYSYKKLIPSLMEFPNDIIVTVDDDVFYEKDWLESLYESHKMNPNSIIAHRARKIYFDKDYNLGKYYKWTLINENTTPSYKYLFTGSGGVLYPPNSLNKEIFNKNIFLNEYKTTDDIWFWAMAILNETKIKTIENNYNDFAAINPARLVSLTNEKNLFDVNKDGSNFVNMQKILKQYPVLIKLIKKE